MAGGVADPVAGVTAVGGAVSGLGAAGCEATAVRRGETRAGAAGDAGSSRGIVVASASGLIGWGDGNCTLVCGTEIGSGSVTGGGGATGLGAGVDALTIGCFFPSTHALSEIASPAKNIACAHFIQGASLRPQ
jgi:hypothetical protein